MTWCGVVRVDKPESVHKYPPAAADLVDPTREAGIKLNETNGMIVASSSRLALSIKQPLFKYVHMFRDHVALCQRSSSRAPHNRSQAKALQVLPELRGLELCGLRHSCLCRQSAESGSALAPPCLAPPA